MGRRAGFNCVRWHDVYHFVAAFIKMRGTQDKQDRNRERGRQLRWPREEWTCRA